MTAGGEALSSKQLLQLAYGLIEEPPRVFEARWQRAAALLARQALETSLLDLWTKRGIRVRQARERSQLLCLPSFLDDRRLSADTALAWNSLSEACHQHAYDLPPTAAELTSWLDTVDELRRAVERLPARQAAP